MGDAAASAGGRSRAQRAVNVAIVVVSLTTAVVTLFFVFAAGVFHVKYAEPNPGLAKDFSAAMRAADARLDMTNVYPGAWDSVSILGPFTGLAAVRACIGVDAWDQDGALADNLNSDNQSALVFVNGGAVTAATWSIWLQLPFEAPVNLCAVPRAKAVFPIATRPVRDPKVGTVTVYRLEPAP